MSRRLGVVMAALVAALLAVTARVARPQEPDAFFEGIDHPAIGYRTLPPTDRVAQLAARLAAGSATLEYEEQSGYLRALLRALDIPIASQLAVFSKTSLQQEHISPQNPRAIYFNDSVVAAWPRGGFIEIASHDSRQGVVFYLLPQQPGGPAIFRTTQCLSCHNSYGTLGVPGLLERSVITGPGGQSMPFLGNYLVDGRSPIEERWAGWFVTGSSGTARHLGNQTPAVTRNLDAQVAAAVTSVPALPEALRGYLSSQSDIAAHLVFDHQIRATNLLTRAGWEVRLAQAEQRPVTPIAERWARDLVDTLLFIDAAALPPGITGGRDFATAFEARGPMDSHGRSLRSLDLNGRLMRYPCSFMVYADAFDGLPPIALDAVYRRMWAVLSGNEKDARYAPLTAEDRRAVVEILRETKKGLPEYFKP